MVTYAPVPAFAERKRYPARFGRHRRRPRRADRRGDDGENGSPDANRLAADHGRADPGAQGSAARARRSPRPRPSRSNRSSTGRSRWCRSATTARSHSPIPAIQPGPVIEPCAACPGPTSFRQPLPVRTGPRFATPDSQLRPPYPPLKQSLGEEATLRLRLSIDAARSGDRGRAGRQGRSRLPRFGAAASDRPLALPAGNGRRPPGRLDDGDHAEVRARRLTRLAGRGPSAYLRQMSWFPRPVGPRAAFKDLAAFLRQRSREQVIGLAAGDTGDRDPGHRVPGRFEDQHRAAAAIDLRRKLSAPTAPTPRSSPIRKQALAEKKAAQAERQRQFQELENRLGL